MPFLEHLDKFNLDLHILRYRNSPHVSCLGRNLGRGWNPNLEESYVLEYSKSEAKNWKKCTSGIYLRSVSILEPDPSPISRYRESTETISFSILGFFRPEVKLGFDFPGVLPNQKSRPWSLNFDFEESNLMPGSLKKLLFCKKP